MEPQLPHDTTAHHGRAPDWEARFHQLLHEARHNELTWQRLQTLQLALLHSPEFSATLATIFVGCRTTFELDQVILVLADSGHELHPLLASAGIDEAAWPHLHIVTDLHLEASAIPICPVLGPPTPEMAGWFPVERMPGSVAAIPLRGSGPPIGLLLFSSRDPGRYQPGLGTEFLAHFGAVAAVCLQNAVQREQLRLDGLHDPLTGLHNRRYFDQRLAEEIARAGRESGELSCILLDVDHFKRINDTYGHPTGDAVLAEVAQRLRIHLRAGDVLARFGGEEFSVLLPATAARDAVAVAERMRAGIAATPVSCKEGGIPVTASAGIASLHQAGPDSPLVAVADKALYLAKNAGRNRVCHAHDGA